MKKSRVIIIAVLILLIVLPFLKDMVIKISVEKGVEAVTGLKLGIRQLNVGIFRTAVSIKGLKVFNPPQFKDRVMVDMPEIYVDYDLPAILMGKVHLRLLRINLKEFVVVKNAKGELNLNSLKVVQAKKEGVAPESNGGKAPEILIDNLELKIGKAFYKNYTTPGGPSIKEFNVDIDERYTNITNPYAVVSIIVVKALSNTAISGLANFDISGLKGMAADALSSAKGMAGKAAGIAQKALENTAQSAPGAVKNTSETAGKAASAVGDLFRGVLKQDGSK